MNSWRAAERPVGSRSAQTITRKVTSSTAPTVTCGLMLVLCMGPNCGREAGPPLLAPASKPVESPVMDRFVRTANRLLCRRLEESTDLHIATRRNASMAAKSWLPAGHQNLPVILGATLFALEETGDRLMLDVWAIDDDRRLTTIKIAASSPDGRAAEFHLTVAEGTEGTVSLNRLCSLGTLVNFVSFDAAIAQAEWNEAEQLFLLHRRRRSPQERLDIPHPAKCQIAVAVETSDGRSSNYIPAFWIRFPTSRPVGDRAIATTQPAA